MLPVSKNDRRRPPRVPNLGYKAFLVTTLLWSVERAHGADAVLPLPALPSVSVSYKAPAAPGDTVELSFTVPPSYLAAILLSNEITVPVELENPAIAPVLLTGAIVIPVVPAGGSGLVELGGTLPTWFDEAALRSAAIEIRIIFGDPQTGGVWFTAPIPLLPEVPGAESGAESISTPPDSPSGSAETPLLAGHLASGSPPADATMEETVELPSPEEENLGLSAPSGPQSQFSVNPSQSSPAGAGNGSKSNANIHVVPFIHIGNVPFFVGTHDQPVPIQGSGH